MRKQQTLATTADFSGIGIHTGKEVYLKFCPAPEGTGIVFKRTDLPGCPIIPATIEYVQDTSRSTTIGIQDVQIHTVEHVLSALEAYQIDNLIIEVDSFEPPVGNGSADVFVDMIEKAGIVQQKNDFPTLKVQFPLYWSQDETHLVALPCDTYRISYTLNYPNDPLLRGQYHSLTLNKENFKKEIASCRTFCLYKEISYLIDKGLIKGGSLDNAVVVKEDAILSKKGLFFPNEMVRHKILDLIGDFSLIGYDLHAHIIAICSGHATNFAFAKQILTHIMTENH